MKCQNCKERETDVWVDLGVFVAGRNAREECCLSCLKWLLPISGDNEGHRNQNGQLVKDIGFLVNKSGEKVKVFFGYDSVYGNCGYHLVEVKEVYA